MDLSSKKRKAEEDGMAAAAASPSKLTPEEARSFIEPLSLEQLRDIVAGAISGDGIPVVEAARAIADRDPSRRKLFVRGLGWDTTTDGLRSLFSAFGDLDDAVVVLDKSTGRSRGFGFVVYRHVDGALLALREPSKKIDGRVAVTQYADAALAAAASAAAGLPPSAPSSIPAAAADNANRKIYVGGVPPEMPPERLLAHFLSYGDIEEGPLGYDKNTGKSRGYAMFVYKTVEGARTALVDAMKNIDGHQLLCKLAYDNKKGKPGAAAAAASDAITVPVVGGFHGNPVGAVAGGLDVPGGDGIGLGPQSTIPPGALSSQYGAPGVLSSFGGYHGGVGTGSTAGGISQHHNYSSSLPFSGIGGSGGGGYGAGFGGPFGSSSQYGGFGSSGYGGSGSSTYGRLSQGSAGTPSGSYADSGHYGLSSSGYQGQHSHHIPSSSSPGSRVPTGGSRDGIYSVPPYF